MCVCGGGGDGVYLPASLQTHLSACGSGLGVRAFGSIRVLSTWCVKGVEATAEGEEKVRLSGREGRRVEREREEGKREKVVGKGNEGNRIVRLKHWGKEWE